MILKIRAWDADNKRMVFSLDEPIRDTLLQYYIGQGDDNSIAMYREGDGKALPTMLFIGQKDSTKKEIFLGDIVTLWTTEDYQNSPPVFVTAEVCYDDEDASFFYHTNQGNFPYLKPWHAERVTVIGNIHETPELFVIPVIKTVKRKKK